jgi:hypothetical protein
MAFRIIFAAICILTFAAFGSVELQCVRGPLRRVKNGGENWRQIA